MVSNRKTSKQPSLAIKARHKQRLFLPMDTADADKLALRFRMALSSAMQGKAQASDVQCLAQTVVMTGLIGDLEGIGIDESDLALSEQCLCRWLACLEAPDWRLREDEARSLQNVVNEHDLQLRQSRLQTLVKATERFERLLRSADTLAEVFDARRKENSRRA